MKVKVKTQDLEDCALDWAVAVALGLPETEIFVSDTLPKKVYRRYRDSYGFLSNALAYSADWARAGPVLDAYSISTRFNCKQANGWEAYVWTPTPHDLSEQDCNRHTAFGPTAVVAGLRCLVLMTLGEEVEIPRGLL